MKFLHWEFSAGPDDVVVVTLDTAANVQLMDDSAFFAYRDGRSYHYQGGLARVSPVRLVPPRRGHWHVVVDLGGYAGSVRAAVRVV